MSKSPEQNFYDPNEPMAMPEAEIILRERDLKYLEAKIAEFRKALSFARKVDDIKRLNDLIKANEEKRYEILQELKSFKLQLMAKKLEQEAGCEKCGAPAGNTVPFCGACGTKNPDFDERELKKDIKINLEEAKKQEGCATGHNLAIADTQRLFNYCIYCGKKY